MPEGGGEDGKTPIPGANGVHEIQKKGARKKKRLKVGQMGKMEATAGM